METDQEDAESHEVIPGSWRADPPLSGVQDLPSGSRSNQGARSQRDYMRDYFNSVYGSVPWQDKMI